MKKGKRVPVKLVPEPTNQCAISFQCEINGKCNIVGYVENCVTMFMTPSAPTALCQLNLRGSSTRLYIQLALGIMQLWMLRGRVLGHPQSKYNVLALHVFDHLKWLPLYHHRCLYPGQ